MNMQRTSSLGTSIKKLMKKVISSGEDYGSFLFPIRYYTFYGGWRHTAYLYEWSFNAEQNNSAKHKSTPKWAPPPADILKINTDGAFREESRSGGSGLTIRNNKGELLAAGAGKLEHVTEPLHSEALAMLHAVNAAIQLGCDRVIFETDSLVLKQAITSEDYNLSALGAVFREIKFQLQVGLSDVCINHVSRLCNQAAHRLAAHGTVMSVGTFECWLG